jgi:hypothetical protein
MYTRPAITDTLWHTMGASTIFPTQGSMREVTSAISASGVTYIAAIDSLSKIVFAKYDEGNWISTLSDINISAGKASSLSMIITSDSLEEPVIAYVDSSLSNFIVVKKRTNGNWITLGSPGLSLAGLGTEGFAKHALAGKIQMGEALGKTYVLTSYQSPQDQGYYSTVYFYEKGNSDDKWKEMFVDQNGGAYNYISMDVDSSGEVYIAFIDKTTGQAKVIGGNWDVNGGVMDPYGDINLSTGTWAFYPTVKADRNHKPALLIQEDDGYERLSLYRYNNQTLEMEKVKSDKFSGGRAYNPSLAFNKNNLPVISFQDASYGNRVSVIKQLASGNWEFVGNRCGINTVNRLVDIRLDSNDRPLMVYIDQTDGKIACRKLRSTTQRSDLSGSYQADGYFFHPSASRIMNQTKIISRVSLDRYEMTLGDLASVGYAFQFSVDADNNLINWNGTSAAIFSPASGFMTADNPGGFSFYPGTTGGYYNQNRFNNRYDANTKAFWLHYGYQGGALSQNQYQRQIYEKATFVPPIEITNISPTSGTYGTMVTITGTSLGGWTPVLGYENNQYAVDSFVVDSDTQQRVWIGYYNKDTSLPFRIGSAVSSLFSYSRPIYRNSIWEYVGTPGFSETKVFSSNITMSPSNIPHVIFVDSLLRVSVKKWNGANWITLGDQYANAAGTGGTTGKSTYANMVIGTDNQPVIAFLDSSNNGLMMMRKYNQNTNSWTTIASGIPYNNGINIPMAVDNQNNIYVLSSTINGANRTQRVYRYNGSTLENIGIVDTGTTNYATIDVDKINNIVYVAYSGASSVVPQACVRKYNGANWEPVGLLNFTNAPRGIYYPTIKTDKNGAPYVLTQFDNFHERLTMYKFNGSSWVINDNSDKFSKSHSYAPSIQFDSQNKPWVSFIDATYLNGGSVLKKIGNNWVFEGDRGFVNGQFSLSSLQLDNTDVPYVTFIDYNQQNRISVMKRRQVVFPVSACENYVLPWGDTAYTTGTYDHTYIASNGNDSLITYDVTILEKTSDTTTINVCSSSLPYVWYGSSYSTSGTYAAILTNTAGCDSIKVLILVVDNNKPLVPSSITQTLVNNFCGERVYRYSATAMLNADGYAWTLPTSVGGIGDVIVDSGDASYSRIVRVKYTSNAAALSTDSIKVSAYSGCGNSLTKAAKLINTALNTPVAPTAITITLIQNLCGNKIYRYSAPALPIATTTATAATGYLWSFTGTLGANAVIDSGEENSRTILVSYTSNGAAAIGDSIKVCYTSACGNSVTKAAKLTNTLLGVPAAPTAVTITAIQTNVCGARKYRYAAPNLPIATTTAGAATGYVWDFVGTLKETMTIDSGDLNSQRFTVTFTSNAAAIIGDSVRVYYTSDCGNSLYKAAKLSNTALGVPAAPTAITITPLQINVCGARKYRYAAPSLPIATTTAGAANGYLWDFTGSLTSIMTIDSGDVNSQRFTVTFTSNAAAAIGDSVRVLYTTNGCGNSLRKAAKLSNTALGVPAAPTAITITPIQTNICSARKYRYAAPNLPIATATAGAANGYLWDFTGSLASTMTIDSGDLNSQRFTVTFTSNAAAQIGDSVRVLYTTAGCGNSLRKGAKLSNTLLGVPVAPTITIAIKSDVCNVRTYRYTAPAVLPIATTTAGAASGYLWSTPTGTVGSTGTIDSGSVNSRIITVTYTSNAAAGAGDSIRLRYTTAGCGNGVIKAQKLSNLVKTGCPPIAKNTSKVSNLLPTSMEVKVYPNPTTSQFNVEVKSSETEEAELSVLDITGRFIKRLKVSSNSIVNLGSDLKSGAYILEVKQGKEVKTIRVIKY